MIKPYPILKLRYNKNTYHDNSWLQDFYYVDYFGNIISKDKYKFAKSFYDGFAFVYDYNQKWDIINAIGNSVLNDFDRSTKKMIEIAFRCITPKSGFFLKNYVVKGNIIVSVNIAKIKKEFEGFDVKGFPQEVNRHGYLLINISNPQKMSLIEDYSIGGEGLIAIKNFDKEWIYISIDSFKKHLLEKNQLIETFEYAAGFSEGLGKIKKGGSFGFIDTDGNFCIPPIYDDARSFSEGVAAVSIANCRNFNGWNDGKKIYDLAWNFISKKNDVLLSHPKYNLSRVHNDKSYYFESEDKIGYTFFWGNLDKNFFKSKSLQGFYGWEEKSIGIPNSDFWYNSDIIGQMSPSYLVDLLTAQNSEELGFHKWWVAPWISKDREKSTQNLGCSFCDNVGSANTYNHVRNKNIIAETIYIDFDTTQIELDYVEGANNLEKKYGFGYTDMKWKTNIIPPSTYYSNNYNIDWSNYNDNLDMDQQDIDFWNQF